MKRAGRTDHLNGPKKRPILFNALTVRAILEGRKTQTRRVMKNQPSEFFSPSPVEMYSPSVEDKDGFLEAGPEIFGCYDRNGEDEGYKCRHGQPGDRLWVRETFALHDHREPPIIYYRADDETKHESAGAWKPSIQMPRWASRITLEITGVRVERVQGISESDAKAEGFESAYLFRKYWEELYGNHGGLGLASNPWVWVIEFCRVATENHLAPPGKQESPSSPALPCSPSSPNTNQGFGIKRGCGNTVNEPMTEDP
jgi:hypothetical protein